MHSVIVPLSFARGIISNSLWLLDNSTCKFHYTAFMKFESHYVQQASVYFVSEAWISLQLTDITAPIVTPWCPSGYLGYVLVISEFH